MDRELNIIGIIPARMASSRFLGNNLAKICHVYESFINSYLLSISKAII